MPFTDPFTWGIRMGLAELVDQLRRIGNCKVYPSNGIPSVEMALPSDVEEFYRLTGGAMLFQGVDYSIEIVPPEQFVRANPVIALENGEDDISFDWFIVARTGEQYITIDLAQVRFGRCYDSFWDCHAVRGDCQVVALSFEPLLEQLIGGRGRYWFWLGDAFKNLGDAYDEV